MGNRFRRNLPSGSDQSSSNVEPKSFNGTRERVTGADADSSTDRGRSSGLSAIIRRLSRITNYMELDGGLYVRTRRA